MITGPMFQSITWGTYVFFAALNIALILPGVYWLFPETRGRSLEDVRTFVYQKPTWLPLVS